MAVTSFMPKHTNADKRLGAEFRRQLRALLSRPENSKKVVAAKLKLTGQALDDLLHKGTVPTLRTVALAVDTYGFSFRYPQTICVIERRAGEPGEDTRQLVLPFVLTAPGINSSIRIGPSSASTIQFEIRVKQI